MPPRKKRKVARGHTHEQSDLNLWGRFRRKCVYALARDTWTHLARQVQRRERKREADFEAFNDNYVEARRPRTANTSVKDKIKCLKYWVKFQSWSFCGKCKLLHQQKLLPTCFNSRGVKLVLPNNCVCSKKVYTVPSIKKVPRALRGLHEEDEEIIRPFAIDIGPHTYAKAGHRIKSGAIDLLYREDTVEERIQACSDPDQQKRLEIAFEYLSVHKSSSYYKYLKLQGKENGGTKIKFWVLFKSLPGIECALWPCLYPFTSWCETTLTGTKDSILHSFRAKLLSSISSYNNNFQLLQFQYDYWTYKTITGAVNTGKKLHVSPLKALEGKQFTAGYWRWQHRCLVDAVLQFGNPSIFLTISPYEWDFPRAFWLENDMEDNSLFPTRCGAIETFHIVHVLDQLLRGYISGCNTQQWETHADKHLFYATQNSKPGNVKCLFHRYEFQQRRTIHSHALLWLDSIDELNLNRFSATVPDNNVDTAFLVNRLQWSNEPSAFLEVRREGNCASQQHLYLQHTKADKAVNLRAYIDTVLELLQCRMDLQCTDGRSALMSYVTSYVSKLSENAELLRSVESTAFQQVWRFLVDLHPGEPEMAMAFSEVKLSYCNLSRFKLVPPTEQYFDENLTFQKYLERPSTAEDLTCLQYCRVYNTANTPPTIATRTRLVGVHYKYIFNDRFFWEYTIVNTPFRHLQDIKNPHYDSLPCNLKLYSYFIHNHGEFCLNVPKLRDFLEILGYNSMKVHSFIMLIRGYSLMYYRAIRADIDDNPIHVLPLSHNLSMEQSAVFEHIMSLVERRGSLRSDIHSDVTSDSSERSSDSDGSTDALPVHNALSYLSSSDEESSTASECSENSLDITLEHESLEDSLRPTLLKGQPGTGKTYVVSQVVQTCIKKELFVVFAYATAFQARENSYRFDAEHVHNDTIHSLFRIPIEEGERSIMNWSLLKYDVVIIDEVAMVSAKNMEHVFRSLMALPKLPVVLLLGDPLQQKPLQSLDGETSTTTNIFSHAYFLSECDSFTLYSQHRFQCNTLQPLLETLRHFPPSNRQVELINSRAYFEWCTDIGDDEIIHVFRNNPETIFLCITRKGAATINKAIVSFLFRDQVPLAYDIQMSDGTFTRIYNGMRIMVTMNLNKDFNLVNGTTAVIKDFSKDIIFIKLSDGSHNFLYLNQVDELNHEFTNFYHFVPDYAMTIFKVQGKNLDNITVWFDSKVPSPGAAYSSFSRVQKFSQIRLMHTIKRHHILPISVSADIQDE